MNKWLPLALLISSTSAIAADTLDKSVPYKAKSESVKRINSPNDPSLFSTTREFDQILGHTKGYLDSALKNASSSFRYLDIKQSTVQQAEEYYERIDPYVHPALDPNVELEFVNSTKIEVTGLPNIGYGIGAFPWSMQLRVYYKDKNNSTKSQLRTIQSYSYVGSTFYLNFEYPFGDDAVTSTNVTGFERIGKKYNLTQWKSENNINEATGIVAAYSNDADLGFGRRMVGKQNGDEAFFYVENYLSSTDAVNRHNLQATVAMEYSRVGTSSGRETQFYVFDSLGNRILKIDLDQEGEKYIPGLCQNCHDDKFIVFDAESFGYSSLLPRSAQEPEFRELNDLVLATNPKQLATELIGLWYQNSSTQNSNAVPSDWKGTYEEEVYTKVIKPYCRACHLSVALDGPMKHSSFKASPNYYIGQICNPNYTMPHAKVTHNNLLSDNTALATITTVLGEPIPCWAGTPSITDVRHDSPIDLTQNASIRIDRELALPSTASRFDVKITRHADNECVNPDTGLVITGTHPQKCWIAQSFQFNPLNGTYNYSDDWVVNPATDLTNWNDGTYTYEVRAWGPNNQLSASHSTTFDMQRPAPSVSGFSLSRTTYNKQENANLSYTYNLTSDQQIVEFERYIYRTNDNQWIDVSTGGNTTYGNHKSTWSVLSTSSTSNPYNYSYSSYINPSIGYANWPEGTYKLFTRAKNAAGQWSNEAILYFYVVDMPVPPSITSWTINPYSWDTNYNGNINFSYTLQASQPLFNMERKIIRTSDWRCINPATGQAGSCWHSYNALSQTSSSPVTYGISGSLNPSTAYATWNTGSYRIYVRGYNAAGQQSNQRYLNFRLR